MQRHFHEELDALKQTLLAMGGLVEDQIRRVMTALLERDGGLAREVIERDRVSTKHRICWQADVLHILAGEHKRPPIERIAVLIHLAGEHGRIFDFWLVGALFVDDDHVRIVI